MITIKKKHNLDLSNDDYFIELQKQFTNVYHYSYNRFVKDGLTLSEVEKKVKSSMNNIDILDASWVKCAVKNAETLKKQRDVIDIKEEKNRYKVLFGGRKNFIKRKYNKIDKNEYIINKLIPLCMRGSSSDNKGNRKATLINNTLLFKPCKGKEYLMELRLSKNEKKMLYTIEQGCNENTNYFNFEIDQEYVYISINEPTLYKHSFKKNRFLGIDLNPNYIAVSIMDINHKGSEEVYKEILDLKELNKTNSPNKKRHELAELNKHIIKLCKSYHVEYVTLEDLNMKSSNKGLGRNYNRLVNNTWLRTYLVNNLIKTLKINDIKTQLVVPHYSSFIGQMIYKDDYDSVAASKEIAFRGYLMSLQKDSTQFKSVWSYINDFLGSEVSTHWKEMIPHISTFKELYNFYKDKETKTSYRFLFSDIQKERWSCLRLKSFKSMIDLITF